MKGFGLKIYKKFMEQKYGKMVLYIKENIQKEKKMEQEYILGQMGQNMKVCGKIILLMVQVYFIYQIINIILVNGKIKKKKDLVNLSIKKKKFTGFYCNDKRNGLGILVWKNGQKAQIGFWKEGKQFGLGKFMNKKKVYFGIWQMNKKVKWLKNEKEWIEYIERNKMDKYKKIFGFDLDNIYDFCYNKDDIDKLLIEN